MAVAAVQSFGNFQVLRLIGEGGFGEVYEAENPFLQRRAAIKVLHTGMDQDPELVRRFLNEARAASAIRHPNIIEVFDAGVTPDGEPYILMEFLQGDSLQKRILDCGRMPLRTVQEIARQAGSALSAAHTAGIVHRDLKPENLFLVPEPSTPLGFRVKVLDFGIAKFKHRDDQNSTLKTQAGLLMGSPSYMSPEQCKDSSDVDFRSDIYSLGIIVYEMLAGVPPFASKSATEMLVMQITSEPPPLRGQVPDLPEFVEQTVMRALAKDREMRFGSVDYFVGALHGTYPALTVSGNATSPAVSVVGPLDRPPGQSLYAAQGFGYAGNTPAPVAVGNLSSQSLRTPAPALTGQPTITTLSHAKGEATPPSTSTESDLDLDVVRPKRWPVVVLLSAVLVAAGVAFVTMRPRHGTPIDSTVPAARTAQPTQQTPAMVRVHIESSPAGATVVDQRDQGVLGATPLDRSYPQSPNSLGIVLRLRGYKDKSLTIALDANSEASVDLERAEVVKSSPPDKVTPPHVEPNKPAVRRKPQRPARDKEDEWTVH